MYGCMSYLQALLLSFNMRVFSHYVDCVSLATCRQYNVVVETSELPEMAGLALPPGP